MSGFTNVTAWNLRDASGNIITNATATFTPNQSFRTGGTHGQVSIKPIQVAVTNGTLSVPLGDTSVSNPQNVSYKLVVTDNVTGSVLLAKGYEQLQPSGSDWSLDDYITPIPAPLALIVAGPQGIQGVQGNKGDTGPAGTTTLAGSNGPFNAQGGIEALPSAPLYTAPGGPDYNESTSVNSNASYYGHGQDLGNTGGWRIVKGIKATVYNTLRGIKQLIGGSIDNYGRGDTAGLYLYVNTVASGCMTASDEGTTGAQVEIIEFPGHMQGTVGATTGAGDRNPGITPNPSQTPQDGGIMLDLNSGYGGVMTGRTSNFEGVLLKLPVTLDNGAALPISTAWGVCFSTIAKNTANADSEYQSVTHTITLKQINGVAQPFALGVAKMLGVIYPEQVLITAVGQVNNGTQSVTFNCRYPQTAGYYLFQGGLAGTFLSFEANVPFHGKRTAHHVGGSIDGQNVLMSVYLAGFARADAVVPISGHEAASPTAPNNRIALTPGAEVTAVLTAPGSSTPQVQLEYNTVPWQQGTYMECCTGTYWGGHSAWFSDHSDTPSNPSFGHKGLEVTFSGKNKGYSYQPILITGGEPESSYIAGGGPLGKPSAISIVSTGDFCPVRTAIDLYQMVDPLVVDPSAAVLKVRNGGTKVTGSSVHRLIDAITVHLDWAQDLWMGTNTKVLKTELFRGDRMSADILTVDRFLQVQGPMFSPYANDKNVATTEWVHSVVKGYTGDIAISGTTIHVANGLITGVN